eukprot:scaffold6391_cov118-Alexandrium_tamarense.AAC.4
MLLPTRTRAFGCGWGCGDDREDDAGCWRAVRGTTPAPDKLSNDGPNEPKPHPLFIQPTPSSFNESKCNVRRDVAAYIVHRVVVEPRVGLVCVVVALRRWMKTCVANYRLVVSNLLFERDS